MSRAGDLAPAKAPARTFVALARSLADGVAGARL